MGVAVFVGANGYFFPFHAVAPLRMLGLSRSRPKKSTVKSVDVRQVKPLPKEEEEVPVPATQNTGARIIKASGARAKASVKEAAASPSILGDATNISRFDCDSAW